MIRADALVLFGATGAGTRRPAVGVLPGDPTVDVPHGRAGPGVRGAAGEPGRRFARQDGVENAWRVVQPALDHLGQVHPYRRGSWGPVEADELLQGGHWHAPTVVVT